MTPYYDHAGITIYHGDCREVLPTIEAGSVDLVLTDPPYGTNYVTARRSHSDKLVAPIANDDDLSAIKDVWSDLQRILRDNRHWYAFCSPRMIGAMIEAIGKPKHILCWDKGERGTVGDLTCGFGESWEGIFYGMKGRRELNGKRPRTVIRIDWSGTLDPVHPTVKPVALLKMLILWSTHADEIILDCFAGSGTSLMAAKQLGRRAIGIEIEERYAEIAARRLSQEVLPL